jgi:hypothetical protein
MIASFFNEKVEGTRSAVIFEDNSIYSDNLSF